LRAALQGRVSERHRFSLRLHLRHVRALDTAISEIDAEANRDIGPFRQVVRQLRTIPGVSDLTAQVIVSEIGTDMSRFPTAGHLISWASLCPCNDESAGKPRSHTTAPWLKTTLVQCAWEGQLLAGPVPTPARSPWPKKAVCAVAASTSPPFLFRGSSLHLARTDQIVGNHGLCERYANWGWWPKNIGCGRSGQVIMRSN